MCRGGRVCLLAPEGEEGHCGHPVSKGLWGHVYPERNLEAESPQARALEPEGLGESVALSRRHTLSRGQLIHLRGTEKRVRAFLSLLEKIQGPFRYLHSTQP